MYCYCFTTCMPLYMFNSICLCPCVCVCVGETRGSEQGCCLSFHLDRTMIARARERERTAGSPVLRTWQEGRCSCCPVLHDPSLPSDPHSGHLTGTVYQTGRCLLSSTFNECSVPSLRSVGWCVGLTYMHLEVHVCCIIQYVYTMWSVLPVYVY